MICIVQDTSGKIFGAYTDINFDSYTNNYKSGQINSFVFMFRDNKTIDKSKCLNASNEIYCNTNYSMTLGNGHCFYIYPSSCNNGANNYINLTNGVYENIASPNNSNS